MYVECSLCALHMCLLSSILGVHRVTPMVRFSSVLLYRPSSTGKESLSSGLPICMWWHTMGTRIAVLPSGKDLKSLVMDHVWCGDMSCHLHLSTWVCVAACCRAHMVKGWLVSCLLVAGNMSSLSVRDMASQAVQSSWKWRWATIEHTHTHTHTQTHTDIHTHK